MTQNVASETSSAATRTQAEFSGGALQTPFTVPSGQSRLEITFDATGDHSWRLVGFEGIPGDDPWSADVLLRLVCHWVLHRLPIEEIPYVTNDLMERGSDYFPQLRWWEPLVYSTDEDAWIFSTGEDKTSLRLSSGA